MGPSRVVRKLASAAWLLASACSAPALMLDRPPDSAASALVLVLLEDKAGVGSSLEAVWAEGGPPVSFIVESDRSARVVALAFDRSLDQLGLTSGLLSPLPPGAAGVALPPHDRAWQRKIVEAAMSPWEPAREPIDPALTAARFEEPPQRAGCRRFVARNVTLDSASSLAFAAPWGDGESALVGDSAGKVFRAHRSGRSETVLVRTSSEAIIGAAIAWDGRHWLGDRAGNVHVMNPATAPRLERVASLGERDGIRWLAPPSEETGSELLVLTELGVLAVRGGTSLRRIATFASNEVSYRRGGLLRLDARRVLAIKASPLLLDIEDGAVVERPWPTELEGMTSIARIPDIGVVVGGSRGSIWTYDPETGHWTSLGSSSFNLHIEAITALEGGFVFAGTSGWTGQYRRETGFCRPALLAAGAVYHIVPLGEGVLLLASTKNPTVDNLAFTLIEPSP